jgi:PAS domain S-box-containing protein
MTMMSRDFLADDPDGLAAELSHLIEVEHQLRAENEHLVEAQRTWQESLQQYAELFDASPAPTLAMDRVGIVRHMNRTAAELIGADMVGASLRQRFVPEDRKLFYGFLSAGRNDAVAVTCDASIVTRRGDVLPVRLSGRPLSHRDGLWIVTFADLTERNRAVEEQRRLQRNEEEARAATAARDQFIAMLSHELRTPLTPVMAAVSAALGKEDLPAPVRKTFTMIARNIEAERRLIDDLLDTTRIAHRKLRVERAPADLHALLTGTLELIAPEAKRKGLTLESDLSADRNWGCADIVRLRQVFWNLLQNAVKFTPEGGLIRVRSWNRDNLIAVEVSDTGVGIAPEMVQRLFIPFQQASQPDIETPSRGGLGLGLAICRGIVELHEGTINVTSPGLGRGTRFIVDLPTIDAPRARAVTPVNSLPPPASLVTAPRRVLLVEDDHDTVETLSDLLRLEGFEVDVATSISAALKADVTEVDVVLSDLSLGDGSGLDLMRKLRTSKELAGIALSGFGSESDVAASRAAGFATHLTKPVSLERLVDAIRAACADLGRPQS